MSIKEVLVPDIGSFKDVEVIEIMVNVGDSLKTDDSLMTVESDKAAMDIPAPFGGIVKELKIKVGDKISAGSLVLLLDTTGEATASSNAPVVKSFTPPEASSVAAVPPPSHPAPEVPAHIPPKHRPDPVAAHAEFASGKPAHASPSVRRFARELGAHLQSSTSPNSVKSNGRRCRASRSFPAPTCTATGSARRTSRSSTKPTSPTWKTSANPCSTKPPSAASS